MRLLGTLLAAACLISGASPAVAAADHPTDRDTRALDRVELTGSGFGHGIGLSQHGAQSAASQGRTYRQILAFYYPGTRSGRAGGTVSVLITADTTKDVVVRDRPGLRVAPVGKRASGDLAQARPAATKWRLVPLPGGRTAVEYRTSGWRRFSVLKGDAQFSAGNRPVTLLLPGGGAVAYRGALRAAGHDTVNVVSLEGYLKGVVPREVPAEWEPHAVRAQAVAARTYAAFERRQPLARHYQICDTTQCQVYGGHSAEHPASNAAIDATRGQVLTEDGRPAFTQFSASNGGYSAKGQFSYLRAQRDPYDRAYRNWKQTIAAATVEAAYPAIGDLTRVVVIRRDGRGAYGGRVLAIRLTGSKTSTTISGDTFRSVFGLRSNLFRVDS